VIGQDIQETADGRFVIAEGVAPDRVISVVDPQARHGHKSNARGFDGYKGHVAIDPGSEVITAAEVGAANAGDAATARSLLGDLPAAPDGSKPADQPSATTLQAPIVYGDAAYGTGALLANLEQGGITAMTKVADPTAPQGHFTKQQFRIDLDQGTVTCPARLQVPIIPARHGGGVARFGRACHSARCKLPAPAARLVGGSPSTHRRPGCRRPGSGSGSGSGLAGRLPHPPAHRGTQARPPATPPARRPPRPLRGLVLVTQGLAAASRGGHLVLQPHLA
jgi:hypothetical protein